MRMDPLLRRGIAVVVIALLLALAFAPSSQANITKEYFESNGDDLIINQNCLVIAKAIGETVEWNLFSILADLFGIIGYDELSDIFYGYSQRKHFRVWGIISMYNGAKIYSIGKLGIVSGEYELCSLYKFKGISILNTDNYGGIYIGFANQILNTI